MKNLNFVLYFIGGVFVAYLFYNFTANLGMFSYALGRPLTSSDVSYYYFIKTFAVILGFAIGVFSFRQLLKD